MYAGQYWFDINAQNGVISARRNPRRKKRLPYHAKRNTGQLPVMSGGGKCSHSLAAHEDIVVKDGTFNEKGLPFGQYQTVSYALPCLVGHKSTTKNIVHRDSSGRKWQ